jgi:hypothetical protein
VRAVGVDVIDVLKAQHMGISAGGIVVAEHRKFAHS